MTASPQGGPPLSKLRLTDAERQPDEQSSLTKGRVGVAAALVLLGAGVGAVLRGASSSPPIEAPIATPSPAVAAIAASPVASAGSVLAGGRVESAARRELAFGIAGVVAQVNVSRGAQVHAGDVLMELVSDSERAECAQMQAALDSARSRLQEFKEGARPEELDQARRDAEAAAARASDATEKLTQAQDLLRSGASTRAQALEAQRNAEAEAARARSAQAKLALLERGSRQTAVAAAEAEVGRARAALAQAQAKLAQRRLVAPADGTITDVRVRTGEATGLDLIAPVVLSDLTHLEVKVDVSEAKATSVKVGDLAVITVEALAATSFHGHVTEVGLEADRQKGTLEVTVGFDEGSDLRLVRPRMAARVAITASHH